MMIEMLMGAVDAVVNPAKMWRARRHPKVAFYQIITIFLEGVLTKTKGGQNETQTMVASWTP